MEQPFRVNRLVSVQEEERPIVNQFSGQFIIIYYRVKEGCGWKERINTRKEVFGVIENDHNDRSWQKQIFV